MLKFLLFCFLFLIWFCLNYTADSREPKQNDLHLVDHSLSLQNKILQKMIVDLEELLAELLAQVKKIMYHIHQKEDLVGLQRMATQFLLQLKAQLCPREHYQIITVMNQR